MSLAGFQRQVVSLIFLIATILVLVACYFLFVEGMIFKAYSSYKSLNDSVKEKLIDYYYKMVVGWVVLIGNVSLVKYGVRTLRGLKRSPVFIKIMFFLLAVLGIFALKYVYFTTIIFTDLFLASSREVLEIKGGEESFNAKQFLASLMVFTGYVMVILSAILMGWRQTTIKKDSEKDNDDGAIEYSKT